MRTILITGSEGHLGRALRARFEGMGDRVIGVDHAQPCEWQVDLDRSSIHYDGASALNVLTDDGRKLITEAFQCDVVICNAKTADWRSHEWLARRARDCIINIGSIYGVLGNDPKMYEGTKVEPTPAWYAASKGALVALTRWQATNLAPVRSNCVCPGGISRDHSDKFRRRYESKVPLGRMATEEDVVNAVEFLASDKAAYITGQVLMVDGGLSCMA